MRISKISKQITAVIALALSQNAFAQDANLEKTAEATHKNHMLSLYVGGQSFESLKTKTDTQTAVNFAYKHQRPNYFFFELDLFTTSAEDATNENTQKGVKQDLKHGNLNLKLGYDFAVNHQFDLVPYLGLSDHTINSNIEFPRKEASITDKQSIKAVVIGTKVEFKPLAQVLLGLDVAYHHHYEAESQYKDEKKTKKLARSAYKGKAGYSIAAILAYQVNDVLSLNVKPFYEVQTVKADNKNKDAVKRAGTVAGLAFSL